jgi:hypothetical protein
MLNFKLWLQNEMAHVAFKKYNPITIDGNYVQIIDMKFENYPNKELKRKLLSIDAKFFGRIPGRNVYIVYDGRELQIDILPPDPDVYVELPKNWADYALFADGDGNIKEPKFP